MPKKARQILYYLLFNSLNLSIKAFLNGILIPHVSNLEIRINLNEVDGNADRQRRGLKSFFRKCFDR